MTKPARFPRSLYLVPGLLLLAFLTLVFWPQSPPSAEVIANRGKYRAFPVEFSIFAPDSWKVSSSEIDDWLDQGAHKFRRWQDPTLPPSQRGRRWLFDHLIGLKFSDKPEDRAEYQRLVKLGEPWLQNLLNRYPELRIEASKLPDERNALVRLIALQDQVRGKNESQMSNELHRLLSNRIPWQPDKVQAWLDSHQDLMNELREIGRMKESSNAGLDMYLGGQSTGIVGDALLLQARHAAEQGDAQAALDSVRTASGIARLCRNADGAVIAQVIAGARLENVIGSAVIESILPSIPRENLDLAAWQDALRSEARPPADFPKLLKAEWNTMTRFAIIPALLDPANPDCPPDGEYLVESYTEYLANRVKEYSNLETGRSPPEGWTYFDESSLSKSARDSTGSLGSAGLFDFHLSWEITQIRTGLTQAAFDILQGKPIPNDPIYGQPYQWNPETRELTVPKIPELSKIKFKPIKLPKL